MSRVLAEESMVALSIAAKDKQRISGSTHNFYRYPARFSPQFAATAIECFSSPGDLVLDPYMGGGTTVVEALLSGRHVVGNDLNSLATFVTRAKVTPLNFKEAAAVRDWALQIVPHLSYGDSRDTSKIIHPTKTRNLSLVRSRFIKKILASALSSIMRLPSRDAQHFARCGLLAVAQWALDGRKSQTTVSQFRERLGSTIVAMLAAMDELQNSLVELEDRPRVVLTNGDAADIDRLPIFSKKGERANLVVTSPPYPGIHILYHRWQVDGRRETPAPYWIADCADGQGASFYNFGDRRERNVTTYFATSLSTLRAIRRVMAQGAVIVQMIAFGEPKRQLPRYLENMEIAGFNELRVRSKRIWRKVPNRRWHASIGDQTSSPREVVLVHEAI